MPINNPFKNQKVNIHKLVTACLCDVVSVAIAIALTAIFAPWWAALIVGIVGCALIAVFVVFIISFRKSMPKQRTKEEMDAEAQRIVQEYLKSQGKTPTAANVKADGPTNDAKQSE